jgi:fatty acid desaturase
MTGPELRALAKAATRTVTWRDLAPMSRGEGIVECLHPLPWLFGSWIIASGPYWPLAVPCAFMFFLTALRLNHEAIHHNLGFGAKGHQFVLHGLSLTMLGSNHAIAWNHLEHHRHIGTERDHEGACGRMGWREVLGYGPRFPCDNHRNAWRGGGPAIRQRMRIDLALNAVIPLAAMATGSFALAQHMALMLVAQCLTAFFAVWITHQGCDEDGLVARTQRAPLVNFLTYNMFFHLEHHLFPGVPVKRLPQLAERLDRAFPEIARAAKRVVALPDAFGRATIAVEPHAS